MRSWGILGKVLLSGEVFGGNCFPKGPLFPKRFEHHVAIHEAEPGVVERLGQGADDGEAEFLPEGDGAFVG